MAQWYVKDLSKLTKVSVQTLHHYDRIGLLEPSVRLANGYRLYSETDLLKLQQIIALKFFGFELAKIKNLLAGERDILSVFAAQTQLLEEKAHVLLKASDTLKTILQNCNDQQSIPWENIIELIEVYRMTEQLENTWVTKFLTADELREYAEFEKELKAKHTPADKEKFEKEWAELVKDINANINNDPATVTSMAIARRVMERVDKLYFHKYYNVRRAIWEKGFKSADGVAKHGLSMEAVAWLDKAIYAYHTQRITNLIQQIGKTPDTELKAQWDSMIGIISAGDDAKRRDFLQRIMSDERTSERTREWFRRYYF